MASIPNINGLKGLRTSFNILIRRMLRLPFMLLESILSVKFHETTGSSPYQEFPQQPENSVNISEQWYFLNAFEQNYGESHPFFYASSFIEALKIAESESKFMFVYLHSPDHLFTLKFCLETLCSELVVHFLDANFISWGAVVNRGEGLEIAMMLSASSFPFCAIVAPAIGGSIEVLQKVKGPVSPEALVEILLSTLEKQGPASRFSRVPTEEEVKTNKLIQQEQDKTHPAALQKDKKKEVPSVVEWRKNVNDENLPGKSVQKPFLVEIKEVLKESLGRKRASIEDQKKKITTIRNMQSYTKLLIRFPNGARKEHMFLSTDTIRSIYKYIDSLEMPGLGSYQLISQFPKKVYGHEHLDGTLIDAGLHPNAALFIHLIS